MSPLNTDWTRHGLGLKVVLTARQVVGEVWAGDIAHILCVCHSQLLAEAKGSCELEISSVELDVNELLV